MKQFKKGAYTIKAEVVVPGTKVYNYLEDANYVTNEEKCVVLTGTAGEQWPVTIAKLAKTYQYTDGSVITANNLPEGQFEVATIVSDDADTIFAEQVQDQQQIQTSWGETLTANRDGVPHGDGDWIVYANKDGQPNPDDRWVVNGCIFADTYVEVEVK